MHVCVYNVFACMYVCTLLHLHGQVARERHAEMQSAFASRSAIIAKLGPWRICRDRANLFKLVCTQAVLTSELGLLFPIELKVSVGS